MQFLMYLPALFLMRERRRLVPFSIDSVVLLNIVLYIRAYVDHSVQLYMQADDPILRKKNHMQQKRKVKFDNNFSGLKNKVFFCAQEKGKIFWFCLFLSNILSRINKSNSINWNVKKNLFVAQWFFHEMVVV